jgi:hypothetical protein
LRFAPHKRFALLGVAAAFAARGEPNLRGDVDLMLGATTVAESGYPFAPAVGAFVGADLYDMVTPGIRFLGVAGARDPAFAHGSIRAYSAAAEVRLHSPGETQFWVSAGAGPGQLLQLQCQCDLQTFAGARPGVSLSMAIGVRTFILADVAGLGGQIGLTRWSHVTRVTPLGPAGSRPVDGFQEGGLWAVTLGITVSGRTPR